MQPISPTSIGSNLACVSPETGSGSNASLPQPLGLVFWPCLILMRWLLIALLVSLAALLIAAAGMTLHIWVQRARLRSKPMAGTGKELDSPPGDTEETDVETDI